MPQPRIRPRIRPNTTPTMRTALVVWRLFFTIAVNASMAYSFFEGGFLIIYHPLNKHNCRTYQQLRYLPCIKYNTRSDSCILTALWILNLFLNASSNPVRVYFGKISSREASSFCTWLSDLGINSTTSHSPVSAKKSASCGKGTLLEIAR